MVLTLGTRGHIHIPENLPWEILELICENSEDIALEDEEVIQATGERGFDLHPIPPPEDGAAPATRNISSNCLGLRSKYPLQKHRKNKVILSMSQVCQSWRTRLKGLKRIWRDISFDVEFEPASVRLATLFLAVVEDSEVPLHIYAGFSSNNLPNPTLEFLLSELREHTHRWERFLYWGRLGLYRSYLNLPAPRLQDFSDNHSDPPRPYPGGTAPFFSGRVPILRSLIISTLGSWQPAGLTNLQTLDLWDRTTRLSVKSLLSVLRCTPRVEEIRVISPVPPIRDWTSGEVVSLLHLKDLRVCNPDLRAIIEYLAVPNVRTVTVVGPAFQTPHPLSRFASMVTPLPMLGQPIAVAFLGVKRTPSGLRFDISFTTEKRTSLRISLAWVNSIDIHRRTNYIQHSISVLAGMRFLTGALLQVTVCGYPINYNNPLFRLDAIEYLRVEGENFPNLQKALLSRKVLLFPNLKFLYVPRIKLDGESIGSLPKLLQFRRGLIMTFDIENRRNLARRLGEVCVVVGESPSWNNVTLRLTEINIYRR